MITRPETAVILAAGLGSRLGHLKENRPKAFLKVGEETLIERSIRLLKQNGINNILIGTGFESSYFEKLGELNEEISTQINPIYAESGSMYTLYLLRQNLNAPILLLEGDLLYEERALHELLDDERDNLILASGETQSGDEVYIQSDDQGCFQNMSKNPADLDRISGELVGICKLSNEAIQSMIHFAESRFSLHDFHLNYEDTLVGITQERDLEVKLINDLLWCEIDDADHLKRAETIVYPMIVSKEE